MESRYATNLVAAVNDYIILFTMSSGTILPGRFDNGDFDSWLREFDACCAANGWKVADGRDDKILKLPAFLRGKAASHFYAIAEDRRKTFKDAVAALRLSLCPAAQRETFYAQFESRVLRTGEDPAVYKWELENLLAKADPELPDDAKKALLQRQFIKGLPNSWKLKLLEHNPTPTLDEMLSFVQRYRAVEGYTAPMSATSSREPNTASATTTAAPVSDEPSQLSQLLTMVAGIAEKQQSFEERLRKAETSTPDTNRRTGQPNSGTCYNCGAFGHLARDCRRRRRPPARPPTCFSCGQLGHVARSCPRPLNY